MYSTETRLYYLGGAMQSVDLVVVAIILTRWLIYSVLCLALKTVVEKVSPSMALTRGLVGPN